MLPIFSQAWYLDAVCENGHWDVALVERGGRIVATLPYFLKRKGPFNYILQPHLCKWLGPYIIPEFKRLKQEQKLLPELIEQFPKVAYFNQNFHYDNQNWMPFMWANYQQTSHYTYHIDTSSLEVAYQNIYGEYRRLIRKFTQDLRIVTDRSIEEFYAIQKMSFDRKSLAFPFSLEFLKRFDAAIQAQACGKAFFVVDPANEIHSVTYLVWDQHTCYGIMVGDHPERRQSHSGLLMVWEMLQYTKNVLGLDRYDFVGSMIPEVERIRRQFGAKQVPYFKIEKYHSTAFQLLRMLKGE